MLTAAGAAGLASTGSRARARRRTLTGYLFLAPSVALIGLFMLVPFVQGIALSFQSWDGVSRDVPWVGLRNYAKVFADQIFWVSMRNAVTFGLIGFVLGNALSLGMAVAVDANPRGAQFYRIAYYLPGVFSVVVVGMMFAWILQPTVGIVNRTLEWIGLEGLVHNWLAEPLTALPSVAGAYVWYHWGFGFLLFLAGLQAIPRDLYEAASIDGADSWRRFLFITWPQLRPVTTIVTILTLLSALQIFGTVQVLTNGGPGYLTEVPTLRIFKEGFQFNRFGIAAAMSVVFGSLLVGLAVIQLWIGRRVEVD